MLSLGKMIRRYHVKCCDIFRSSFSVVSKKALNVKAQSLFVTKKDPC